MESDPHRCTMCETERHHVDRVPLIQPDGSAIMICPLHDVAGRAPYPPRIVEAMGMA